MGSIRIKLFGINLLYIKHTVDEFKFSVLGIRLLSKCGIENKKMEVLPVDAAAQGFSGIKLCLREGGGLGDSLFQLTYLKELKKYFHCPVKIDFYCRAYKCFQSVPFLDRCLQYVSGQKLPDYDIVITSRRLWDIFIKDEKKVKELSPEFFEFYCKNKLFIANTFAGEWSDANVTHYATLFNKNRFEQPNIHDFLPIDRYTPKYLNWDDSAFGVLKLYGLEKGKYITICRAVDAKYSEKHPKLWPLEYYDELIGKIKKKYPNLKIIQVGSDTSYGVFSGVDVCLAGQTSLEQVKVLLKYSVLHIDGEGGLVHMKRHLNGTSVVLFGPTSPEVYGYEENINLQSRECPVSCCQISRQWANECMKYHIAPAPCMKTLTPRLVFDAISGYLDKIHDDVIKVGTEDKISKNQVKNKSVIVFGRPTQDMLTSLQNAKNVTVYDENLALEDAEYPNNCEYLDYINKLGWKADFAPVYNIPEHANTYDVAIICAENIRHMNYAILEMIRVIKIGGAVFCRLANNIEIHNTEVKASKTSEFTMIIKTK